MTTIVEPLRELLGRVPFTFVWARVAGLEMDFKATAISTAIAAASAEAGWTHERKRDAGELTPAISRLTFTSLWVQLPMRRLLLVPLVLALQRRATRDGKAVSRCTSWQPSR